MSIIDIHSHVLPKVDDGAKNLEETIALLNQEKEQGITHVICTPHFYPQYENLEDSVKTANDTYNFLKSYITDKNLPHIYLGREVHYFYGISNCTNIENFSIENTTYLLLELPFLSPILPETIDEIKKLSENFGFTVIIAHIERYYDDRLYKKIIKLVKDGYALAQCNADSYFCSGLKRPVEKLLKQNLISFIGSDAHSQNERPVRIKEFVDVLEKKYPNCLEKINYNNDILKSMLKNNYDKK